MKEENTKRQNKREKSPCAMLNTALLRCSVELVHSTGMAHVITHMQASILSSNWSLKLPSFPNIFSVYLAQD